MEVESKVVVGSSSAENKLAIERDKVYNNSYLQNIIDFF